MISLILSFIFHSVISVFSLFHFIFLGFPDRARFPIPISRFRVSDSDSDSDFVFYCWRCFCGIIKLDISSPSSISTYDMAVTPQSLDGKSFSPCLDRALQSAQLLSSSEAQLLEISEKLGEISKHRRIPERLQGHFV